jgi:hypothetical protein
MMAGGDDIGRIRSAGAAGSASVPADEARQTVRSVAGTSADTYTEAQLLPGAATLRARSGDPISIQRFSDGGLLLKGSDPYAIAGLLHMLASHSTYVHDPVGKFVESMTTLSPGLRAFTAERFGGVVKYDSKARLFEVTIVPREDWKPAELLDAVSERFSFRTETEMTEPIDDDSGKRAVSAEDVRLKLGEMFEVASLRYASRLGLDYKSIDARLTKMRNIRHLISEPAAREPLNRLSVLPLEAGVVVTGDGEVVKLVIRFTKKLMLGKIDFRNVVTWTGMISADGRHINWNYHEKYRRSEADGGHPPSFNDTAVIVEGVLLRPEALGDVRNVSEVIEDKDWGPGGEGPSSPAAPAANGSHGGVPPAQGPQTRSAVSGFTPSIEAGAIHPASVLFSPAAIQAWQSGAPLTAIRPIAPLMIQGGLQMAVPAARISVGAAALLP